MSMKRAIRAILVGTIVAIFGLIYLPQCGLEIAPQDMRLVVFGFAGVLTFLAYRFS